MSRVTAFTERMVHMYDEAMSSEKNREWILGISASHNGGACLLHNGELVVATQEERLTRTKRTRVFGASPSLSVKYCLDYAGIAVSDLDAVGISVQGPVARKTQDIYFNPQLQVQRHGITVFETSHHLAHAMSAFALSGADHAAILVVDGMGSPQQDFTAAEQEVVIGEVKDGWEIISMYEGSGKGLRPLEKHLVHEGRWLQRGEVIEGKWSEWRMPKFGSLGGIFSAAAQVLFGNPDMAGKVMGLAPCGTPTYPAKDFFSTTPAGTFEYLSKIPELFADLPRWPDGGDRGANLAASCQVALEEALFFLVNRLRALSSAPTLCYAGGVALNSVANEKIQRAGIFDDMFVIPAAEDSGCSIGSAYSAYWSLGGEHIPARLTSDSLGRTYSVEQRATAIGTVPAVQVEKSPDLLGAVVERLCRGEIIGWMQGGAELGPRALGHRSIICDPRLPDGRDRLNAQVKHREAFRPFAPACLQEHVREWFELDGTSDESPFMLRVCRFKKSKVDLVPAVVHVDGTGRVQTVTKENGLFYQLIKRFHEVTGYPLLVNTSFNVAGEPIVETPEDALWCLLSTDIDACVIDSELVTKKPDFTSILQLIPRVLQGVLQLRYAPVNGKVATDQEADTATFGASFDGLELDVELTAEEVAFLKAVDGVKTAREIYENDFGRGRDLPEDLQFRRLVTSLRRRRVIELHLE